MHHVTVVSNVVRAHALVYIIELEGALDGRQVGQCRRVTDSFLARCLQPLQTADTADVRLHNRQV